MIVQRPNVMERIEKGEAVGYVIIVVGVIGVAARALPGLLPDPHAHGGAAPARAARRAHDRQSARPRARSRSRATRTRIEEDAEVVELRISEAVLREVPRLERFQAFLRLAVAAGPLLGLIGTVIGMIITFQSITESGSSDPRLMANGIGQAMIATVLGLGIAIPLLFMNAGLASMSRSVVQILDEQSTGLLAESLERTRERDEGGLLGTAAARRRACLSASSSAALAVRRRLGAHDGRRPLRRSGSSSAACVMWTLVIERTWYFSARAARDRRRRRSRRGRRAPITAPGARARSAAR